ncbi:hypothetical protein F8S13_12540 [Chloroflexia bacterium SDU3-3]|nr:hypothetical protein F8S13_12540 [Chloroflexia bacterium SDU3-3]
MRQHTAPWQAGAADPKAQPAPDEGTMMTTPEHAELVERLLGQLGLEDKIRIVSGRHAFEHEGAAALPTEPPIPPFSLADGPAGVRVNHPGNPEKRATALPAPIALAATWDVDAARRYGDLVGAEMAATGHNIMLGPAVDIARVPVGGRLFESFGEDPLLQARMAVAEIRAIQAHGVAACVKHYLANNQESQRASIDVQVDARTLRASTCGPLRRPSSRAARRR